MNGIGEKLYILNKYAKKCRDVTNTLVSYLEWYDSSILKGRKYVDIDPDAWNNVGIKQAEELIKELSTINNNIDNDYMKVISDYLAEHSLLLTPNELGLNEEVRCYNSTNLFRNDEEGLRYAFSQLPEEIENHADDYGLTYDEYVQELMNNPYGDIEIYLCDVPISDEHSEYPSYKDVENFSCKVWDKINDYSEMVQKLVDVLEELNSFKKSIYDLKTRVLSHFNLQPVGYHQIKSDENTYLVFELEDFSFHCPTLLKSEELDKLNVPKLENLIEEISSEIREDVTTTLNEALKLFDCEEFDKVDEDFIDKWKIGFVNNYDSYWRDYEYYYDEYL